MKLRTVAVILTLPVMLHAFWWPYAIQTDSAFDGANHPVTLSGMERTAADIDQRLSVDDRVWTVMAEYYALADARPPYTSRIYHLTSPQHGRIEGWNRTVRAERVERGLARSLRTGDTRLVIMTQRTHYMFTRWPLARQAFRANFCRVVPTPDVYRQYDVRVYEYVGEHERPADCQTETQWGPLDEA